MLITLAFKYQYRKALLTSVFISFDKITEEILFDKWVFHMLYFYIS